MLKIEKDNRKGYNYIYCDMAPSYLNNYMELERYCVEKDKLNVQYKVKPQTMQTKCLFRTFNSILSSPVWFKKSHII
jgi:hypothetical protein